MLPQAVHRLSGIHTRSRAWGFKSQARRFALRTAPTTKRCGLATLDRMDGTVDRRQGAVDVDARADVAALVDGLPGSTVTERKRALACSTTAFRRVCRSTLITPRSCRRGSGPQRQWSFRWVGCIAHRP